MASKQQSPATTTPTGRPRRTRAEIEQDKLKRELASIHRLEARLLARQNRARGIVNDSPKENEAILIVKKARRPNQAKRELGEAQHTFVPHSVPRHVMIEALNVRQFAGGLFVPTTNTGGTAAEFFFPDPLLDPTELFEVECLGTAIPSHVAAECSDWEIYVEEDTEETLASTLDRRTIKKQIKGLSPYDRNLMLDAILHRLFVEPGAISDEEEIVLECLDDAEEPTPHSARLSMFL